MSRVKHWLQEMLGRMFQPISRRAALHIATEALADRDRSAKLSCHGTKPANCNIYCGTGEPCWYIYAPWSGLNDPTALRSRRVMLVGKLTGTIHYDGSAGDEG